MWSYMYCTCIYSHVVRIFVCYGTYYHATKYKVQCVYTVWFIQLSPVLAIDLSLYLLYACTIDNSASTLPSCRWLICGSYKLDLKAFEDALIINEARALLLIITVLVAY